MDDGFRTHRPDDGRDGLGVSDVSLEGDSRIAELSSQMRADEAVRSGDQDRSRPRSCLLAQPMRTVSAPPDRRVADRVPDPAHGWLRPMDSYRQLRHRAMVEKRRV